MDSGQHATGPTARPTGAAPDRPRAPRGRLALAVVVLVAGGVLLWLSLAGELLPATSSSREVYPGVERVELDLRASGDVRVVAGDAGEVVVERRVRSFLGGTTRVEEQVTGGTLRLRTRCRLPLLGFGCGATYELRVPAGAVLAGRASNGGIDVRGVRGELELATSNGPVVVEGGEAPVALRTSNGRIELRATRARRIRLETSNGAVTVLAEAAAEAVTARTSNGDVELVLPAGAPAYAVEARTSNGRTDVRIPTDPSAESTIEATTSNGDITIRTAD